MNYGLGIDTGGTYTDAVIYDFDSRQVVASSKSVTVKEHLETGITAAIDALAPGLLNSVRLVSLSTTLATNACVEGRGGRTKLIMIGCHEDIVSDHGAAYGLPPRKDIIFLAGGCNQQGVVVAPPDWEYLKSQVLACRAETDAFAIVELWGVRNPGFEQQAKALITQATGLPSFCGHELTGELNSLKRAASALLNAQLIPIIENFLDAVRSSLTAKGLKAPLVIVRGDGSLMSEEFARINPVETLLCGPAASVAGGLALTDLENCVIVDMGGTTSDIAVVEDGVPQRAPGGAHVGKWKTGIPSIRIDTVGLGGDSLIRHNNQGQLDIGPVRAAPLSWMVSRWPQTLESIRTLATTLEKDDISLCEFFYLVRDPGRDPFYTEAEHALIQALAAGPRSLTELAHQAQVSILEIKTKRLEHYGLIQRCGLTPTDLMHLTGAFQGWNTEAARLGAEILAFQLGLTVDQLVLYTEQTIKEQLYCHIVRILSDGSSLPPEELVRASYRQPKGLLQCHFSLSATLVGLGAPTHIYLPDVARALGAEFVIPENAAVANAVGAITGNVLAEETVQIIPLFAPSGVTGYTISSSLGTQVIKDYEEALTWARAQALQQATQSAQERGAGLVETHVEVLENGVKVKEGAVHLIEVLVKARAVGKIKA